MVNFPRQARDKHMRKAQKGGDLFVCVQGEPLPREGRRLENHKEYMQPLRAAAGEKNGTSRPLWATLWQDRLGTNIGKTQK